MSENCVSWKDELMMWRFGIYVFFVWKSLTMKGSVFVVTRKLLMFFLKRELH